jgi:hypothetical protein
MSEVGRRGFLGGLAGAASLAALGPSARAQDAPPLYAAVGASQPVFGARSSIFPGEAEPSLFLILVNDGAAAITGDDVGRLVGDSDLTIDRAPWWTTRDFPSARLEHGEHWGMRLGLGDLAHAVGLHEVVWKGRGFEARARFRVLAQPDH